MTRAPVARTHRMSPAIRRVAVVATSVVLLVAALGTAAPADDHSTGLERAAEATLQGLDKARGKAADAPGQQNRANGLGNQGDRLTGRQRAAAAIAAALERGNGNGNAHGRGHAAYVHEILVDGSAPGQLDAENHGQAVREMVHAYNELRRSEGP